jgi:DNA-binding MarR family transcriptional regulator
MRSAREHSIASAVSVRELRVLEEVTHRPRVSQRQLADRLGVALGATNVIIRRLADQGYIRASKVGWRRWSYAITARGVSHKALLAQGVVEQFLSRYSWFRSIVQAELEQAGLSGRSRVAIVGSEEMSELIYLALTDLGVENVCFYSTPVPEDGPGPVDGTKPVDGTRAEIAPGRELLGRPVRSPDAIGDAIGAGEHDVVVVATAGNPAALVAELIKNGVAEERLVTLSGGPSLGAGLEN